MGFLSNKIWVRIFLGHPVFDVCVLMTWVLLLQALHVLSIQKVLLEINNYFLIYKYAIIQGLVL